ncbi:MAG: hypothetical protein ABIF71_00135 [Planctomycetota bacterium]
MNGMISKWIGLALVLLSACAGVGWGESYGYRVGEAYAFAAKWPAVVKQQFNMPYALAVDSGGYVYLAETYGHRIIKLDPQGELVATWGKYGTGLGELNWPTDIAVGSDGRVYVADTNNHRVQVFKPDGIPANAWGRKGNQDGEFNKPMGIDVDADGNVIVTESSGNRVQKFTGDGNFRFPDPGGKWVGAFSRQARV